MGDRLAATRLLRVAAVNAASTIVLPMAIGAVCAGRRAIRWVPDHALCRRATLVRAGPARRRGRAECHVIPGGRPRLDPIGRPRASPPRHIAHHRSHVTFAGLVDAGPAVPRAAVPGNPHRHCDAATGNARGISSEAFRDRRERRVAGGRDATHARIGIVT